MLSPITSSAQGIREELQAFSQTADTVARIQKTSVTHNDLQSRNDRSASLSDFGQRESSHHSITTSAVSNIVHQRNVGAMANVVQTADEMVGTLVDIRV